MAFSGLPPSPNWYCSSTCDADKTGVLAYASRNSIVLVNISEDGQSLIGFLHGHEQRVAAVAFNKLEDQWLATCSDDCLVNVWNWRSKSRHKGHKNHESKVTSLSWHPSKKDVLTTGDEKGKIISWNQTEDVFDYFSPEKESIACLAYSNGADQWLAVGYKRGLILILDTRKKEQAAVVFRLRGHDDNVHSMCWSPSITSTGLAPSDSGDADSSRGPPGGYLLSGGEDQHVRIWLPREEKMVHAFKLPPKGGSKSKGHGDNRSSRGRLWVTVCWPKDKPEQFLSSSFGGDILFWDLNKSGKQKWTVLDSTESHNRPVYSLLPIREKFFLTSSMDRQLILWNLETLNTCWSTPTLGGFIYRLTVAPKDTATIAMGVGDNMIRVWNTNARGASCKSTTLWQGLRSKVTVICWHPEKEGVLAFGSEDGRVGIFTSINPSKSPNLSRTFHKQTVYSLSFGPHCCKPDETIDDRGSYCLYSSGGEGVVYQHHDDYSLHQEAVGIDTIIRSTNSLQHMFPLRSEVSWRLDRKVVALGNDDGSIEIFAAPHLSMLCTITVHHKIINCLQWFPCQPFRGQSSPLQYFLASGSNESVVHVHDLAQVLGQEDRNRSEVITTALSFPGHLSRITSLQWNPLADGKLASVSYDGTAQIWDVSRGEPLANFRGHHGRLLSVAWSHVDPDEIFTGGEDFCVMRWRISECTHKQPPKDKKEFSVKFYNSGSSNKEGKKKKKKNKESSVFSKGSDTSAPINDGESPTVVDEETASETSGYTGGKEPKASPMVTPETNEKELMSITELLEKKRRELTVGGKVTGASSMGEDGNVHVSENSGLELYEDGAKIGEDGEHKMKNGEETENFEDVEKTGSKAKRKKGKSYFPVCSQLDNRGKHWYLKDCLDIADRNYGHTASDVLSEDLTHLGLFTSKKDLSQAMTVEGRHHQDHGNMDFRLWLDVWQGKFLTVLREAIHKGQLSDKMVAMAPQAGHDVWLETCSAYAKQLEQNRDPQKAATYYICCHQIHNAVRVLKENKHFREAASVATARLSRQDAARIDVYREWAAHLEEDHKFEAAARCYLAIDEPVNAANLLARGGSQAGLRAALGVAISADKKEILYSLVSRYANECMLNGDWSEVWKIPPSDVTILCLHLVMIIHEAIVVTLLRSDDPSSISDAFSDLKNSHHLENVSTVQGLDHFSSWPILTLGGTKPLLSAAVSVWETEDHAFDVASKGNILEAMQKLFVPMYDSRILKQFLISAAVCVALDWMEDAVGINRSYSRMENILQECLRVGDVNLMKALLSLVYPNGFFVDMLREPSPEVAADEDYAAGPTEACYAYAVLYHLWWDRAVSIDQETSVREMRNTPAEGATKASPHIESPLSDESDGINAQRNVPSPLASSEIEANGCSSATGREDTQNALPSEKKQSDVTPVSSCRDDSQGSLREVELHPSSKDRQDEENITAAWNRFVFKRTKICKKVLVRTNAVLLYRLRKELAHIKDARCSKEAEADGDITQGTDESSMEKECNSLINREEGVGSSSSNITEVPSGTACESTQSDHLPMFKKYLVPSVTMATLTTEESRLEQELANLDSKAEPPDPIESLLVIASLSTKVHLSGFRETDGEYTAQALVAYGIENSCTESQERHFMKLKTKLDKVNQS